MYESARFLQSEIAQHFHTTHPKEDFTIFHYANFTGDIITLLVQKLERDTWTQLGFVNALIEHLSGSHMEEEAFRQMVASIQLRVRGSLAQRIRAYAIDFVAPITRKPYIRPAVTLDSIC